MAKPARSSPPPAPVRSEGSLWFTLALVALCSATAGSLATYVVLRPRLAGPRAVGSGMAAGAPAATPGALHEPPAALTAGLDPAAADRARGNFYYDHGNWPKAIASYEAAIRQGSDDSDIRTDLGNVYMFSGRLDEALAQYALAQRMNPNHEFSLFNQGGLYRDRLNDPAKAIEVWSEYLRRFPNGRNVGAARQLIAETQARFGAAAAGSSAAMPGAAPTDADLRRLQQLTNPGAHSPGP